MSKIQVKSLQKLKASNSLTMREMSSIVGGNKDVVIKGSFNDTIRGTSGDDFIVSDPILIKANGRIIYDMRDYLSTFIG